MILSPIALVNEFRAWIADPTIQTSAIQATIKLLGPVKIDGFILKNETDIGLTIKPAKQNERAMTLTLENGKVIAR